MYILITALISLIALEHLLFLILEMFLWTKPLGLKVFLQTQDQAEKSRVLAANQGLYNGFLATGLLWGLLNPDIMLGKEIVVFFLICVSVAGVYGGVSVNKKIFYIQALPALIVLVMLWI